MGALAALTPQAIDSIHQVGVYCLALVPANTLPKAPLGGIHISETKQRFLEGALHPCNVLMCPHTCVTNLPKPRQKQPGECTRCCCVWPQHTVLSVVPRVPGVQEMPWASCHLWPSVPWDGVMPREGMAVCQSVGGWPHQGHVSCCSSCRSHSQRTAWVACTGDPFLTSLLRAFRPFIYEMFSK